MGIRLSSALVPAAVLASAFINPGLAQADIQHTVAKGHTIEAIAARYRVSSKAIIEANKLKDVKRLQPGDVLTIPGVTPKTPSPSKASSAARASCTAGRSRPRSDHRQPPVDTARDQHEACHPQRWHASIVFSEPLQRLSDCAGAGGASPKSRRAGGCSRASRHLLPPRRGRARSRDRDSRAR